MNRKKWTIGDILIATSRFLKDKGIENPRLCAEVLLSHQLSNNRIDLYLELDRPLNEPEIEGYRSLVRRRLKREPLHYITGRQEFWSLEFSVNSSVLIPRPETECLVEEAIKLTKKGLLPNSDHPRVLDMGTGSGAIAVSLAKELEDCQLWASDISFDALTVAKGNAGRYDLNGRIKFCQGDIWSPFSSSFSLFDLIISNPPYISEGSFKNLAPEISLYEPRIALSGRENGMYFIEKIIQGGPYLKPGGWLLIEMDPHQTYKALELIKAQKSFDHQERLKDYRGNYRIVKARKGNG